MARAIKEHKGLILLLACVGQFMVVLDVSIVNVALPAMKRSLGFTDSELQWILNAYTLSFAGLLMLGGRIADIFGRRKVFLLGLVVFTLASLGGALSQSQGLLIAARAVQGLGAAILSPATLTIVTTTFTEGRERAKALGVWSAVAGAGGATGALLGGLLTDILNWRWIFLINVPIGVVAGIATMAYLTELKRGSRSHSSLDLFGSVLVTVSVTSLVYGLVETGVSGWTGTRSLFGFGLGLALMAYFIFHEAKVASHPIVPLSLFKLRQLSIANITMFFVGASVFASWYFLSLYMQQILGYSPLKAGLAFVPQTLAIALGAQVSSRLIARLGVRPLIVVGPLLSSVGLFLLHSISVHTTYVGGLMVPSVLMTLGVGLSFTPLAVAATSGVERAQAGLASGLLNTARQLGGAMGLAALTSYALSYASSDMSSLSSSAKVSVHAAALISATAGYAHALEIASLIALVAAILGTALGGQRRIKKDLGTEEAPIDGTLGVEGV